MTIKNFIDLNEHANDTEDAFNRALGFLDSK